MSAINISCSNLSKYYYDQNRNKSFALDGINFDVTQGYFVGIAGKNGCGKTTLLKILSGILKPSKGSAIICGKSLAVLEVGTGFVPELSGFDNIELSCKLHGLSTAEIRKLRDEIIAFSEIEAALNEPVKNYSQGMYLRLAMAVMLSLKADVYFFDEVIAVGDAMFQHKCFEKINALKQNGATIMLVTHNFQQVMQNCNRAIVLVNGKIVADGLPNDVKSTYMNSLGFSQKKWNRHHMHVTFKTEVLEILQLYITADSKKENEDFDFEDDLAIVIKWKKNCNNIGITFHLDFSDEFGNIFFATSNPYTKNQEYLDRYKIKPPGKHEERLVLPSPFFTNGKYQLSCRGISFSTREDCETVISCASPIRFTVNHHKSLGADVNINNVHAPLHLQLNWLSNE
jgi:lipopolysaccharide transport system ATP-binding protein